MPRLPNPVVILLRAKRYYGPTKNRLRNRLPVPAWQVTLVSIHFSVAGAVANAQRHSWGPRNFPIIEQYGTPATLPGVRRLVSVGV